MAHAVAGAIKSLGSAIAASGEFFSDPKDPVPSLKRSLECMAELLRQVDAVPKRQRKHGQLPILIKRIRDLAYRAEDVIDTYAVDVESKDESMNPLWEVVHRKLRWDAAIQLRNQEIEAINREIEEAKKNFELFAIDLPAASHQQRQDGSDIGSSSSRSMPENNLYLNDEVVVGIEGDVTQLVELLTNSEHDFKVLAIVGTGGAGKTTLASQIYHHHEVQRWFSHTAFISISQQWDATDLLQRIAEKLMGTSKVRSSGFVLLRELHDFMKDKRCLVVLDDIWHKEAWDAIRPMLPPTEGSRVILTTRKAEVPPYADSRCVIHEPPLLTEDQKWELFRRIALEGRDLIEKNGEIEMLGKEMSKKCRGLPLEVVTLAGILRTKKYVYQWEAINKDCVDNILQDKEGVVEDMLELSYLDLPSHLKPCFLYLAIIPEDDQVFSEEFTQLLIAERFITNDLRWKSETLEDVGMRSLDELAQRCIIKVTERDRNGQILMFGVHDLMRYFCIRKADEDHFLTIDPNTCPNKTESSQQPRRISICSRDYWPLENHHLRSIVYFGGPDPKFEDRWDNEINGYAEDRMEDWKLAEIHNRFKLLRVLRVYWIKVVFPTEIGKLVHLTYLELSLHISALKLPDSVKNLRNLRILHLGVGLLASKPYGVVEVPEELVRKMKYLRVLYLQMKMKSATCPKYGPNSLGLSGPENMIKLSCYTGKWVTQDLPTSSPTLQHLDLFGYLKTNEEMAAIHRCASIINGQIRALNYKCESYAEVDLQKVLHCTNLQSLEDGRLTTNCMASTIQFPTKLENLDLMDSGIEGHELSLQLIEVLGKLPKLKYLALHGSAFDGRKISCSSSSFAQLRELTLSSLPNLEEWRLEKGAMARLKELNIFDCCALKRLPECLRFITTLTELNFSDMSEEFCRRIGYDVNGNPTFGGEDSYIIQHIPHVGFYRI